MRSWKLLGNTQKFPLRKISQRFNSWYRWTFFKCRARKRCLVQNHRYIYGLKRGGSLNVKLSNFHRGDLRTKQGFLNYFLICKIFLRISCLLISTTINKLYVHINAKKPGFKTYTPQKQLTSFYKTCKYLKKRTKIWHKKVLRFQKWKKWKNFKALQIRFKANVWYHFGHLWKLNSQATICI